MSKEREREREREHTAAHRGPAHALRRTLQMSGVIKMAPIVVQVVIRTERATSPFAMYAHRFDAWPPLIEPTRTMPAVSAAGRPIRLERPNARAGMRT